MGWFTAQGKTLLFCAKTIVKESRKFEEEELRRVLLTNPIYFRNAF